MNKILPSSLSISGADTHLYRIGLSLHPINGFKRRRFYNPVFVFIIITQLLLRNIVYLQLTHIEDPEFHLYIGDIGYFIGAEKQSILCAIAIILIPWCSLVMNWYNYYHDIKRTDIHLFRVISGIERPISIGLTDPLVILKLCDISRIATKFAKILTNSIHFLNFLLIFPLYWNYLYKLEYFMIAIINTLSWSITAHYLYSIIVWQFVYYYIITYYLKMKFNLLVKNLKNIGSTQKSNIYSIIQKYTQILSEISEYNYSYYSMFLFIIWLNISSIISIITYLFIFVKTNLIFKLLLIPINIFFITILLIIIHISAAIYIESNNSYQLLNSLFCLISQRNTSIYIKFKVILIIIEFPLKYV